ncbi:hypothetical protein FRC11_010522 [Ceratobasidium sp. 423]|nr:hypothetical protein FRC11_010522 [Ceratobasidium sp. 423]
MAKRDTEKIGPHRAEVKQQNHQHEVRKQLKAQHEDFTLDFEPEEGDSEEDMCSDSDLPDAAQVGRKLCGTSTNREGLIRKIKACGDFEVSDMDESELEKIYSDVKAAKKAKKQKIFSKSSKVMANGPARPAMSPKKATTGSKWTRSRSPSRKSSKRSRNALDTHSRTRIHDRSNSRGRSKSRNPTTDHGKIKRKKDDPSQKSFICSPSRTHSAHSYASSRTSSCAPLAIASSHHTPSAHSDNFNDRMGVDDDDDGNDNDDSDAPIGLGGDKESDPSDSESDEAFYDRPGHNSGYKSESKLKSKSKSKVKSSDFRGTECLILDDTIYMVECHLLLINYFLGPQDFYLVMKEKWEKAVRKHNQKTRDFPINEDVVEAVKLRIQSFWGRLRNVCVEAGLFMVYGLGKVEQGLDKAIEIIDAILPHELHQKPGSAPGLGWFQHNFIGEVIYRMIFKGWHPLIHGILEKYKVKPMPPGECRTNDENLSLQDVEEYYKIHRKTMRLFVSEQREHCYDIILPLLQKRCFERGGTAKPAPVKTSKKVEVLTAGHFAKDEPTEEERIALGLPPKTTVSLLRPSSDDEGENHTHASADDPLSPSPVAANVDDASAHGGPTQLTVAPHAPSLNSASSEAAGQSDGSFHAQCATNASPVCPTSPLSRTPPSTSIASATPAVSKNNAKTHTDEAKSLQTNAVDQNQSADECESPVQGQVARLGKETTAVGSTGKSTGASKSPVHRMELSVELGAWKGARKGPSSVRNPKVKAPVVKASAT